MGGDLIGESDGTNGARFTVTLPAARGTATATAAGAANGKVAIGAGAG